MLSRDQILTPPEPDELRDRRIIAALTPSPIRAHRIASEPDWMIAARICLAGAFGIGGLVSIFTLLGALS